jgi:beta-lactam-binding protein with PASTA domain
MRRLVLVFILIVPLAMAAMSLAAGDKVVRVPASVKRLPPAAPPTVVVPDVRKEAFVFAKSQLQDAGFAWKVVGGNQGYAANVVVTQSPAPGTKLVDTGAPLITVTLSRNKQYKDVGDPENTSPYSATKNEMAS